MKNDENISQDIVIKNERNVNSIWKGELIGEGSYAKVYEGLDIQTGEKFAIKEMEFNFSSKKLLESKVSSFEQEIDILSRLDHKNIIKYHFVNRNENVFQIFLEYCEGYKLYNNRVYSQVG
jgi:serine/threonine protein kinase